MKFKKKKLANKIKLDDDDDDGVVFFFATLELLQQLHIFNVWRDRLTALQKAHNNSMEKFDYNILQLFVHLIFSKFLHENEDDDGVGLKLWMLEFWRVAIFIGIA